MIALENTLIQEVDNVGKQVKYLLDKLEGLAEESKKSTTWLALEKAYNGNSLSAEALDSKTHIHCIVDRVKEFTEKRKFYELTQAIDDAIAQIKEHQEKFPQETLGEDLFTSLQEGLNAHNYSLRVMRGALTELQKGHIWKEHITKQQLKDLAENLERYGEELEDNLPFFSTEDFNNLEKICETFVLKSRKKAKNRKGTNEHRKEEWRRRVRYAAGFILNLIEIAKEDATEEDQEIIQDFLAASHSSFNED
jgi:hypothetical protein